MIYEKELCDKIIGCAIEVHKNLNWGYQEKVYENALMIEFKKNGINAQNQVPYNVHYDGQLVGEFLADIVVEDKIILELKACDGVNDAFEAQLLQYLTASGLKIGYIINFGSHGKLFFKRMVR